jgi:HSP20 family molecular chaperone IbpA
MVYSLNLINNLDSIFSQLFYDFPKEFKPPLDTNIIYNGKTPEKIIIQSALAGFNEEDIEVWFEDRLLLIKGDNSNNKDVLDKFKNSFSWKLPVSDRVDLGKGTVVFENGLLTITLPVIVPEKTRVYMYGKKELKELNPAENKQ